MPEIPNVITGETIESEWGNDIRDRTVQRYTGATQRTSLHPSPTPGDLSYLADTGDFDVFHSGAWRHLGVPSGTIVPFGGTVVPDGWLVCNGTAVSRTTYSTLFSALGITYGAGDGSTTFNLPNLQGRFPLGKAAAGTGSVLGSSGGSLDHFHTGAAHSHTVSGTHSHGLGGHTHNVDPALVTSTSAGNHSHTMGDTTSAGSHSHSFSDTTSSASASNSSASGVQSTSTGSHSHTVSGTTGSGGSHSHGNPSTGAVSTHQHDVNIPTTESGAPLGDTSVDPGGSGVSTSTQAAGNSGTGNPPFLALTYIVKT